MLVTKAGRQGQAVSRSDNSLTGIGERLAEISNAVGTAGDRLQTVADAVFGSTPQAERAGGEASARPGSMGEIVDRLDNLEYRVKGVLQLVDRLEPLAR